MNKQNKNIMNSSKREIIRKYKHSIWRPLYPT